MIIAKHIRRLLAGIVIIFLDPLAKKIKLFSKMWIAYFLRGGRTK